MDRTKTTKTAMKAQSEERAERKHRIVKDKDLVGLTGIYLHNALGKQVLTVLEGRYSWTLLEKKKKKKKEKKRRKTLFVNRSAYNTDIQVLID